MKTGSKIHQCGTREWRVNGKRHRVDGPALEYADGTRFWFQNGQTHRVDGPAVEYASGTKHWYQNDKLHRLDGPAVEDADGSVDYWIDGTRYPDVLSFWLAVGELSQVDK